MREVSDGTAGLRHELIAFGDGSKWSTIFTYSLSLEPLASRSVSFDPELRHSRTSNSRRPRVFMGFGHSKRLIAEHFIQRRLNAPLGPPRREPYR
jgi:hypothetical protein